MRLCPLSSVDSRRNAAGAPAVAGKVWTALESLAADVVGAGMNQESDVDRVTVRGRSGGRGRESYRQPTAPGMEVFARLISVNSHLAQKNSRIVEVTASISPSGISG
jgi:hypothetical protein